MDTIARFLLAYASAVVISLVVSACRHPVRGTGTRKSPPNRK
jgi:hypothetical protein